MCIRCGRHIRNYVRMNFEFGENFNSDFILLLEVNILQLWSSNNSDVLSLSDPRRVLFSVNFFFISSEVK